MLLRENQEAELFYGERKVAAEVLTQSVRISGWCINTGSTLKIVSTISLAL
jgi:hypothetical protein